MTEGRLLIVEGPDAGRSAPLLPGARVVVGRDPAADLTVRDANVSRRHCALRCQAGQILVEDLGSRHGTYLDGARLTCARPAPDGGLVRIGDTLLEVRRLDAAPAIPGLRLERILGVGGSGVVYAARAAGGGDETPLAVKILSAGADRITRQRFEREAALRDRLDHPGLARVRAHGVTDGRPYLVRDFVPGRTLEARVAEDGPLPWPALAPLARALADALGFAHARGVVHRDVKPANVVLGPADRSPCLIDFDLARVVTTTAARPRLTETGAGLGTLLYAAPEQLAAARAAGPPADVYGLGLTLRYALSGRAPFADVPPEAFFDALLRRGVGPLPPLDPPLPPAVVATLERAAAVDPAARFADGGTLLAALAEVGP